MSTAPTGCTDSSDQAGGWHGMPKTWRPGLTSVSAAWWPASCQALAAAGSGNDGQHRCEHRADARSRVWLIFWMQQDSVDDLRG